MRKSKKNKRIPSATWTGTNEFYTPRSFSGPISNLPAHAPEKKFTVLL